MRRSGQPSAIRRMKYKQILCKDLLKGRLRIYLFDVFIPIAIFMDN